MSRCEGCGNEHTPADKFPCNGCGDVPYDAKIIYKSKVLISGVGKDAPIEVNKLGGKQSKVEYRFDLVDPKALFATAKVLKEGFDKYGSDQNWRNISTRVHLNHLLIHVYAYLAGDKQDEHLSHAVCRAIFALGVDIENRVETR